MAYLNSDGTDEGNLERYKLLGVMSGPDADDLEQQYPGFHAAQFEIHTSWIQTRLRKRYAVEAFARPYVPVLEQWLVALVGVRAFQKKGVRQTDEQFQQVVADAKLARDEVAEAAKSETGLFDLPLRTDTASSGITKGGPLSTAQASPYVGFDLTAAQGRYEDQTGRGS